MQGFPLTILCILLMFPWLPAHSQEVQQSAPKQDAPPKGSEKAQTPAAKTDVTGAQQPPEKAPETPAAEPEVSAQEKFGKGAGEKSQLPLFGYDVFRIDTSQLTPGPIDPASYFISPGDKLLLRVWGQLNLDHQLEVSPDLYVTIPEVGRVHLGGQTLREAEATATREMANVYASFIDPNSPAHSKARVELMPTQVHEVRFLVQGEVQRPGSYALHPSLANLVYGLALAGGVKETGALRQVRVRRGNKTSSLDFYDFLLKGGVDQYQIQIQNNDVIFVPMKVKEVSIRGEVRRPGKYELREGEDLQSLINMAGGLKPSASLEKALILRTELNEGLKTIDVNLKELQASNQALEVQDQDVVNIFSSYLYRSDYVSVRGQGIALPGEYQLRKGVRITNLLNEAGGLTGLAYLPRADLVRTRSDMTRYHQTVDLRKVLDEDAEHNLVLQPLDELMVYTVQEIEGKEHFVTLSGHIKNPGRLELYQGMHLYDLLFANGGFQDKEFFKVTYKDRGDILRISEDGSTRKLIKFNLEKLLAGEAAENIALQNDDQIIVYSVNDVMGADHYVTLSGHVRRPAKHKLYEGMTLLDLLDIAGGFQDREFRKETFLERADLLRWVRNGEQLERKLIRCNLGALLLGDETQNHRLEANDEVVVYAAKDFMVQRTVSIDGFVKKPGDYEYVSGMTLGDLLVQASGLLQGAYARAEISRMDVDSNPNIKKEIIAVDIDEHFFLSDEASGVPLRSNDKVFVRKHPEFEKQAIVEITGEVKFPGRYVLKRPDERVSELVERAGGFKESGHVPAARFLRGEKRVIFDLEKACKRPGGDQDLVLRDGDRLEIPKFENVVHVRGAVLNEMTLAQVPGKGVDYYISMAGGYKKAADKDNVTIVYPDGRELKQSGFLWFGTREVEPMSVINVP